MGVTNRRALGRPPRPIPVVPDRHGLPVCVCIESATPHEVKLATSTLVQMVVPEAPQNLIADNAYDSDQLDEDSDNMVSNLSLPTAVIEETQRKIYAACGGIVGGGRSRGYLLGYKISVDWWFVTNDTPTISSECFSSAAA